MIFQKNIENLPSEHFFKAINIYIFNPHVINRKLFGTKNIFNLIVPKECKIGLDLVERLLSLENPNENSILSLLVENGIKEVNNEINLDKLSREDLEENSGLVILNKLLPRNLNVFQNIDILTIVDFGSTSATFSPLQQEINVLTPKFPYKIIYQDSNFSIDTFKNVVTDEKSENWLKNILSEKILKWIGNLKEDLEVIKSISLIENVEEYNELYSKLKEKYGTKLVKIWPETTDPKKYVYEDVAIATYLLLLWKQERTIKKTEKLQSFVDIGCGNGLLVYILSSEGHQGVGIDLRKRKIWDMFPDTTKLEIKAIVPSNESLFPDTDWIIGNHSDELSPWIPVIAARSSFQANYFLLPCCAFEFDGTKYQRKNCGKSQYADFLDYAKIISEECGFETKIDRLKIPSTKRICLIGEKRVYEEDQFEIYSKKIKSFIDKRTEIKNVSEMWSDNFKPRESIETVRNCTKIERNIIDEIVKIVFDALMTKKRHVLSVEKLNWNAGGIFPIADLVKIIPQDKLLNLKSECGGLQTLLKNNHQIFQVESGLVQLRIPTKIGENVQKISKKKKNKSWKVINFKEKQCWFYCNHPDGCPFEEKDCRFKH